MSISDKRVEEFIVNECLNTGSDDAFYVFNVEDVIRKHELWRRLLPRVMPYYAMKACPYPLLLEILYGLGVRYDCASQYEIDTILGMGVDPSDIIFANPCKPITAIKHAKQADVVFMTFDNEEELSKIHASYPEARLLLRIKVDDRCSSMRLGRKFGAHLQEVESLLRMAKHMTLNVSGVAFHVGSGCQTSIFYANAIRDSRVAWNIGLGLSFKMTVLDCGGGYPGSNFCYTEIYGKKIDSFAQIAADINHSLDVYYPESHVTVIGEPGSYYCESAFTLVTKIIAKRCMTIGGADINNNKAFMYFLNDGIFGSFLAAHSVYGKTYRPIPMLKEGHDMRLGDTYPTILWGPTCDSSDRINETHTMPEMMVGEYIVFEDMGSYSLPFAQYGFNGIPAPKYKIYMSEFADSYLKGLKNWHKINQIYNKKNLLNFLNSAKNNKLRSNALKKCWIQWLTKAVKYFKKLL